MASVTSSLPTFFGQHGLWSQGFTGRNTSWVTLDQRIICGNFFSGLQGNTYQAFQMNIPHGAIIETATMQVTAFQNNGGAFAPTIFGPQRYSGALSLRPYRNPSTHLIGWRPAGWAAASMVLINTTFGGIAATGGAPNAGWNFRQIQAATAPDGTPPTLNRGNQEELAQIFTTAAVGNLQINTLTSSMNRSVAAPLFANMRVHIYSAVLDSDGVTLVPGVSLAFSTNVSIATFQPQPAVGNVVFVFSGAQRITLSPSTTYFAVWEPDPYPFNNTNYAALRYQDLFFGPNGAMSFGQGIGADWQNSPQAADVTREANGNGVALDPSTNVLWNMPIFLAGVTYTSPDIAPLIKAQTDSEGYAGGDRTVAVAINGPGGLNTRIWRNNGHVSNLPPRLTVTWRNRYSNVA